MLEIILEVISKKDKYDYRGEKAQFVVEIESPELINAIDLNVIKNSLAEKAVCMQKQKCVLDENKDQ
jgi:hypothetical protein